MDLLRRRGAKMMSMMKGYGQFCPVAKAAEVLAQRWTPLILRELCSGAKGFNELMQGMPLISRSVLSQRLSGLREAGVITAARRRGAGSTYALTHAGEDFRPIIELMSRWGQTWAQANIEPDDLDPALLIWGLRQHIDRARLPERAFIIQFEFSGLPHAKRKQRYWWLLLRKPEVEVCLKNPGYAVDVVVAADMHAFVTVWLGYRGLRDAGAAIRLDGRPKDKALAKALLGLAPCAMTKTFSFVGAATAPRERPS